MKPISKINLIVLILFHSIGLILFASDPNAAKLSYVTLLISGCALLIDEKLNFKKTAVLVFIFCSGYLIEFIGTQTGLLFGDYSYGNSLGFKIKEVPLIIGLNWVIIVVAASSIVKRIAHRPIFIQAIIAGLFCTFLDWLIEPVAINFDFWSWESASIPLFNYICWFGFSFLFSLLYLFVNRKSNRTGEHIYIIWTVFFIILNFL